MQRLQDVPRHNRQAEFESLFCLGPKELLLKTYSASLGATPGKLWISTGALCFSGSSRRIALRFCDVSELRCSGFRSIVALFAGDGGGSLEFSGLWHRDECFAYVSALWWNTRPASRDRVSPSLAPSPPSSSSSPHLLDQSIDGEPMVLVSSGGDTSFSSTSFSSMSARGVASPQSPVNLVDKALDDLDEVADLLLLPTSAAHVPPRCDQYGFPLDNLEQRYNEFMQGYSKEQSKMRRRWLKFLQMLPPEADICDPAYHGELLSLLMQGLPPDLRPSLYFRISGGRRKRLEAGPGYYCRMREESAKRARESEWGRAVEKDLMRTYPYHIDFSEEEGALIPFLRNVLLSYGLRNPAVGYW